MSYRSTEAVAYTQSANVNEPVPGLRAAGFPRSTLSFWPSNCTALPRRPATQVGPFTNVPALPLPDESAAFVPLVSSSFQIPTAPVYDQSSGYTPRPHVPT